MSKICAIHQPNFLPWLGYFYKISKADVFVILDDVDIEINTSKAITNRTKIKTNNGVNWLTIPIKKGNSKKIMDIEMVEGVWKKKFMKTIQQNYCKSLYFDEFFPVIQDVIEFDTNKLSEYNSNAILKLCRYMDIKVEMHNSSELGYSNVDRNGRIIEICHLVGSNVYLSGNGGRKYHDEEVFKKNCIEIQYAEYPSFQYNQINGDFVEGLSIVDYLFNNGKEKFWTK